MGTFRAAECRLFRPGTSCAYGNRIPVPVRVDGTRRRQKVPDGVDCPHQREGPPTPRAARTPARPPPPARGNVDLKRLPDGGTVAAPASARKRHSAGSSTTSGASPGARTSARGDCTTLGMILV